jgi:NAD/NADP transhydrogenase beta subunit
MKSLQFIGLLLLILGGLCFVGSVLMFLYLNVRVSYYYTEPYFGVALPLVVLVGSILFIFGIVFMKVKIERGQPKR